MPVSVEPVEPVFPEVAAAFPSQLPVTVTHGAMVMADPEFPEFPELPEFPEFPDVAVPSAVAAPVFPELASPDEAVVSLLLVELAAPEVPPVVVPLAVEPPLLPDVPLAVEVSWALPVPPEVAEPVARPDWAGPEPADGCWPFPWEPPHPEPCWPPQLPPEPLCEPAVAGPLCGLDVAGPLLPEPLEELLPAEADPVAPVLPDWVLPKVLASPVVALEPEFDVVLTAPD